jgi:PEGA domain
VLERTADGPEVRMKFGIAIVLSLSIIGASEAQTHASSAVHSVTGYLSITTNPANAAVFLDGQHVGVSPVQLLTVAAGEHRVRIVKTGYLENERIVTVGAGLAKNVHVRLTRTAAESAAAGQVVSRTGGGGGGSKEW